MPLEDKERVEALKGASALYYGLTTPAGHHQPDDEAPDARTRMLAAKVFGNSHGADRAGMSTSAAPSASLGVSHQRGL